VYITLLGEGDDIQLYSQFTAETTKHVVTPWSKTTSKHTTEENVTWDFIANAPDIFFERAILLKAKPLF